jgi:hypothetical protein
LDLDTSSLWVHEYYYYSGVSGSGRTARARIVSYVEKDTLIMNVRYHKVIGYISKILQNSVSPIHFNGFPKVNYIREDTLTKKVYRLDVSSNQDSVCLDYNLQAADTLGLYAYPNNPNSSYPLVLVDSVKQKMHAARILQTTFFQHPGIGNYTNEQIEGVGMRFQFPFNIGGGEWNAPGFHCLCYSKKDTIEYLGIDPQFRTVFSADSCYKQFRYGPSSTKNFKLKNVSINFFENQLSVQNKNESSLLIRLIDLTGKSLLRRENSKVYFEYDLKNYPTGVYVLSIQSEQGVENRKILIR